MAVLTTWASPARRRPTPEPGPSATPLSALRRVLLAAAAAVVVAALLALVVVPRALGWVPLTVLSGSMDPAIPTGSQVVVRPVGSAEDVARVAIGDVITFLPRPDDPTPVTHRVVAVGSGADGKPSFTTKGDANRDPDAAAVTALQLRGVVMYHVPAAGYLATAVDPDQKRIVVLAGGVALAGYAAWQLIQASRSFRRERAGRVRHRSRPAGGVSLSD